MQAVKKNKLEVLRQEILDLQGPGNRLHSEGQAVPLGSLLHNMPEQVFPTGVIHEFLSPTPAASAATNGFISAVISFLRQGRGPCLWVSLRRDIFPPALKAFGLDPDQVFFLQATGEKEALWAIEEALRCRALSAVVGEIKELDFTRSRRLQLAVEHSGTTGFIHRLYPHTIGPTACVTRWKIRPAGSRTRDGLPGIGFPRWQVELLKVRNGRPGCWEVEWIKNKFRITAQSGQEIFSPAYKTGTA